MTRSKWRRRRSAWAALVLLILAAGCASPAGTSPAGPPILDVRMTEYRFDFDPGQIRAGRVVFSAKNAGKLPHELVLIILPPEVPPILDQLRSTERQLVARLASIPPRAPGRSGAFAVDLEPGRYAMVCFVSDADGSQHGPKGMASEFTVR